MAIAWALLMKGLQFLPENALTALVGAMSVAGLQVNIVLMVLNLLPIPPLDGGRIAMSLLPNRLALGYARLEPFGFPVILALVLLLPQVLMAVMMPMVHASIGVIETLFRL
jgi:Zn-dependent protease